MSHGHTTFPYAEFIDGLEEAIYWHNAWFSRGVRQLIFGADGGCDDLNTRDAHLHCKLGAFFDYLPTPPGHAELKAQIEDMHQQMHALMRESILAVAEGQKLDETTFSELEEAQSTFFINLHGLLRKVMEDYCAQTKSK
jgi:hypothetical protein